jgi:hypothetical protein
VSAPIFFGPLSDLRSGTFAFFPAIVGTERNEWRLRTATLSEVVVQNVQTAQELTIARHWLGEVSSVEGPVLIVGLIKELELREGVVIPHRRKVLQMPRAVNDSPVTFRPPAPEHKAPVVAIRTETPRPSQARRWFRGGLAAGVIACIAAGVVLRDPPLSGRYGLFRTGLRPTRLSALDDYSGVVEKLGRPALDEWLQTRDGLSYRRLWYPRPGVSVILAGEGDKARYAGALNGSGHVLHATAPALMNLISTR